MNSEEKYFACKRYGHAEGVENPVLGKLLEDEKIKDGITRMFDMLTNHLVDILVKTSIMKKLDPYELCTGEPIINYTLTLDKTTKDELILHLAKKIDELKKEDGEDEE